MMKLANHRRMALFSPKMRSKGGSIVSRSSSVSFTSKTINGRAAMFPDSCLLFVGWSALVPESVAMRGLLGTIAADRHAAPSSCLHPGMVGEHQRAAVSLARLHAGEIFLAHEFCQRFAD